MTKEDKNLILALSLGDGCLKINKKNGKESSGVFHINHSIKQRMYIEWKHKQFERILNKKIKLTERTAKAGNGKEYSILTFSVVDKYFKVLKRYLSVNGEKRISVKALSRLDPLGLAILYLDDGSLLKRKTKSGKSSGIAVRLHLSLYKHEIDPIIKFFKRKWGIEFTAYKENATKELYLLYANTINAYKFLDLIKDRVENEIGCMRYKII